MCLSDSEDGRNTHTSSVWVGLSVLPHQSLVPNVSTSLLLVLPDKLPFYQSAAIPSRQTLSARRLAGFNLPISSPTLASLFPPALPTLCVSMKLLFLPVFLPLVLDPSTSFAPRRLSSSSCLLEKVTSLGVTLRCVEGKESSSASYLVN